MRKQILMVFMLAVAPPFQCSYLLLNAAHYGAVKILAEWPSLVMLSVHARRLLLES